MEDVPRVPAVLLVRLHDPGKLLRRPEGLAILEEQAALFRSAVPEAGGRVERADTTAAGHREWRAAFPSVERALHCAVMLQDQPARLQTACGVFLADDSDVRRTLFPRESTGGRIVITERAYESLGPGVKDVYEWGKPTARKVRRDWKPPWRWGAPWNWRRPSLWWRQEHDPRACYWDERYTLLNAPFERAFASEMTGWIQPRRVARELGELPSPERPDVGNELYGLALGGGGMRAAVFSLGVAQAMARNHALKDLDYIATVSGGGYFGVALQGLLAEPLPYDGLERMGLERRTFPFSFPRPGDDTPTSTGKSVHGVESPALRYIREHARLLGRSIGLFDGYTWRIVGQILLSVVLLWLCFLLPALALGALFGMWFRDWFAERTVDVQRALVVVPVPVVAVAWVLLVLPPARSRLFKAAIVAGQLIAGLSVVVAVLAVTAVVATPATKTAFSPTARVIAAFSPLLLFGISAVAVLTVEWLCSRAKSDRPRAALRAAGSATSAYFARLAAALTGVLGVVLLVWLVDETAYSSNSETPTRFAIAVSTAAGMALALASTVSLAAPLGEAAKGWAKRLLPRVAIAVGGYLALGVTLAVSTWGLWWLWTHDEAWWVRGIAAGSALLLVVFGVSGRPGFGALNWLAPHRLYAELIDASWVIAAREPHPRGPQRPLRQWWRVWPRPDLTVASLLDSPPEQRTAPYPLVCTTLNIPGSRSDRMPDRTCESFVIAPLNSGSALTRWDATASQPDVESMKLARAAAVSGAAVAPGLGFHSKRTYSVLLTLFNVRLGQWLRNPRRPDQGWWRDFINSRPLALYWKEMLGLASRDDGYVYLSDGEHFEGLGVYELLRRRCKYIVAVEADIEGEKGEPIQFGKLASTLRLARVDFGVEVAFESLHPLMRDPNNPDYVLSYFAVGVIRYPAAEGHKDEGLLIVVKSGLVEDTLPVDVLNYRLATDPGFPYYPTQDLQYDQPQFESLRQLGYLAGTAMCRAGRTESTDLQTETVEARIERIFAAYRSLCEAEREPAKVQVTAMPPVVVSGPPPAGGDGAGGRPEESGALPD